MGRSLCCCMSCVLCILNYIFAKIDYLPLRVRWHGQYYLFIMLDETRNGFNSVAAREILRNLLTENTPKYLKANTRERPIERHSQHEWHSLFIRFLFVILFVLKLKGIPLLVWRAVDVVRGALSAVLYVWVFFVFFARSDLSHIYFPPLSPHSESGEEVNLFRSTLVQRRSPRLADLNIPFVFNL